MGQGGPGGSGKILGLILEHDLHPLAVESTLIRAGLRWRDVEHPSPRRRARAWQDIYAVLATSEWDSPLARTRDDWQWGDPKHDLLVSIYEATVNGNVQRGNQSKAKKSDFLNIPRPWDQKDNTKRIGTTPMPLADLDAWLDGSFTPETTEEHGGKYMLPDPS